MADSLEKPWSDNPNAPKIPYLLYSFEKSYFAGLFIASILYGVLIVLFFKCVAALFNPIYRRGEPIKWGFVSYTVIMFSLVTLETAMIFDLRSISYIDNRDYPGGGIIQISGPYGYQFYISLNPISIIPVAVFLLSNWLADGHLLYRCYLVYCTSFWAIAFPCLVYLSSIAMGIVSVYQNAQLNGNWAVAPYFLISCSLNIILTLMITIRLILSTGPIRSGVGIAGIGRLCKAIITMFIESCALYAVSSLLYIGPWMAGNGVAVAFFPILTEIQAIAPLLIIHRVANKSALASNTVVSGHINAFKAGS